jgi:hypothetical protein
MTIPGIRHSIRNILHFLDDDRGVAALEGLLVFLLYIGVLLGCMLLGQWGTHLQNSQMGARLLTFNAGDANLARFGRAGDTATRTLTTGTWDTLASSLPTSWLNTMFTSLTDDRSAGRVKGTQRGRIANQNPSLVNFSTASVGYFSHSSAASNPWAGTAAAAKQTFMGIAYYVGRYRVNPAGIGSKPTIPTTTVAPLETIYARIGAR